MSELKTSDTYTGSIETERPEIYPLAGDQIDAKARHYADLANTNPLMVALKERRLSVERYRHFITQIYPIVVGFNYGLIHSLDKVHDELDRSPKAKELVDKILQVDHVQHSDQAQALAIELRKVAREENLLILRALAGQLKEEQEHNDYYRAMLETHGIDHQRFYNEFHQYLESIPNEERSQIGQKVNDPRFSPAVLALTDYLAQVSTDPQVQFITYHALTSAIEFTLVRSVSESIYPGVSSPNGEPPYNSKLVPDVTTTSTGEIPTSIRWWDEHAQQGRGGRIEMQHIEHGLKALNDVLTDPTDINETLKRVNIVLDLLVRSI